MSSSSSPPSTSATAGSDRDVADTILNGLTLIDQRLNRLKGYTLDASACTQSQIQSNITSYEKIKSILSNARLLLKEQTQDDDVRHISQQVEIRLSTTTTEIEVLVKRLADGDYQIDSGHGHGLGLTVSSEEERPLSPLSLVSREIERKLASDLSQSQPNLSSLVAHHDGNNNNNGINGNNHGNNTCTHTLMVPPSSSSLASSAPGRTTTLGVCTSNTSSSINDKIILRRMSKLPPIKVSGTRIGHYRSNSMSSIQAPAPSLPASRGHGERLATLQSLLKAEILTNSVDNKVMDDVGILTRGKTEELYKLVYDLRSLNRVITDLDNLRISITDVDHVLQASLGSSESARCEVPIAHRNILERLVTLIRSEPSILADTLFRAGYLDGNCDRNIKTSFCDLSQAIVFSMFGNCCTATDERLLLALIKRVVELEFAHFDAAKRDTNVDTASVEGERTTQDKQSFGLQEHFSLTLLSTYLRHTFGQPYISAVLKELVVSIIQDHNMNLESDPQKKPMLAVIGFEVAPDIDELAQLQRFSGEFLHRTMAMSAGLPFGMRWTCKLLLQLYRQHIKETRPEADPRVVAGEERELIIRLVYDNFFIPALINPDRNGLLTGLGISQKMRHNLNKIARTARQFLSSPHEIPAWLNESMSLEQRLSEYFAEIPLVEEPETYFNRPVYEAEMGQQLLVSSTDLFIVMELIYQNTGDNMSAAAVEAVAKIKEVQGAANLQDGMRFLVLNVQARNKTQGGQGQKPKIAQEVLLAKENLTLVLVVLNSLCGYMFSTNTCELLLLQSGRNRSMDVNILDAQIEETIRSLWALPESYKENDYEMLIELLFEDYRARQERNEIDRKIRLVYLDQLQRITSQVISQKSACIEYINNQKFRMFRDVYTRLQTEFVSEFMSRFSIDTGYCSCCPNINEDQARICETCCTKSTMVATFFKRTIDAIEKHDLWKDAPQEELDIALCTLERNLMTQIYNYSFHVSTDDVQLTDLLRSRSSMIDLQTLEIPAKYANQAPWKLAQQELTKLNLYKTPHDKLKCVIDTWNIILNYTKPLGDCGADDYLTIMGYVILKAKPDHILSNVQYISLYITQLDPSIEKWFTYFKTSVEMVRSVLDGVGGDDPGWVEGVIKPTR
ncbi:hypothetical protein SAMD00019534_006240 [Acytostelium subglobosum LB1]|uniref:hypothetical protein n=1 Tax=Acytostelium subglobosum LB1 TaxID=1410327 RepID=UPI0006451B15|nr:hypothetical protein SAMD00019534_006240 [Acytostelium subglobosum LB1]GAM17449.1 hypothetical protein SAMD00019534_006240 [Acytostelium subglobosum LB1]|eukprot:XP_012759511.1 hypothetical protein SAMD00019534_006240 [Acytostelium subglobosum LB1]